MQVQGQRLKSVADMLNVSAFLINKYQFLGQKNTHKI
jgi:hypothetical protein